MEQMPPPEGQTPPEEAPEPPEEPELPEQEEEDDSQPEARQIPPRRRGRPKAGMPALPGEGFFDKLAAVTNWEDNQLWVYRVEPITDRLGQGKAKFIRIWAEACDENKIMFAEGSGVYSLLWKQRPASGGPLVPHAKYERLEIENKDFPPRIEPGDWLEDHRNRRWAFAKAHYDAAVKKEQERVNPPQTMTVQDTIALVGQELDKRMNSGPKDSTLIEAFNTGISAVKAAAPAGENQLIGMLRDEIKDLRADNSKLADRVLNMLTERARTSDNSGPAGIAEQAESFGKLVEVVDKVRPPRSGGGRGPDPEHPGWRILETGISAISPGLNFLFQALAQKVQSAPPPAGQQQNQQPKPTPAAPATQIQAGQPQPPAQPKEEVLIVQEPQVLQQHFAVALEWCFRGADAADFADWLNAGYPTALTELRQIGSENPPMPWSGKPAAEAIMEIARNNPKVWPLIFAIPNAEARLSAFIAGVLAWTPAAEDEDEDGHRN